MKKHCEEVKNYSTVVDEAASASGLVQVAFQALKPHARYKRDETRSAVPRLQQFCTTVLLKRD